MVYVDDPIWPLGRMKMCHMIADSLEELHQMADTIGVARRHFQDGRNKHYDVCRSKRALAIEHGAKEVTSKQIVEILKEQRTQQHATGD